MTTNHNPLLLSPSLLSADFADLRRDLDACAAGGADWLHVDVMDGHFVPNLTLGPFIVKQVKRLTRLPLDCHLMIERPDEFLEAFVDAGADRITVHVEAVRHLHRTVTRIRELGALPGVVLNPATPVVALEEIVAHVDLVLVMSVNPGFGGQAFIPQSVDKVRRVRELIERKNPGCRLSVDGGVSAANAAELVRAGADVLVSGNAVFSQDDLATAIRDLRAAAVGE